MRFYLKYTLCFFFFFIYITYSVIGQKIIKDPLTQKFGCVDSVGNYLIQPKYDFISQVCNNHIIVKEFDDSVQYALIDLSDSVVFKFEYIPMSNDFFQHEICDADFNENNIFSRMIDMCIGDVRTNVMKVRSICTIDLSFASEELSCLLIDYVLNNQDKVNKDLIEELKSEKVLKEGYKNGKNSIE